MPVSPRAIYGYIVIVEGNDVSAHQIYDDWEDAEKAVQSVNTNSGLYARAYGIVDLDLDSRD